MTNFEHIKQMSVKEMAILLGCIHSDLEENIRTINGDKILDSFDDIEEWLEQEVDDICNNCIHLNTCYKIEHYGRNLDDEPCDDFINKNSFAEIVKCKDCKFRGREDCSMYYRCNCGEQHTWETDNDFCSGGERKEYGNG